MLLAPLTKKVSRVPVSRQNWANARDHRAAGAVVDGQRQLVAVAGQPGEHADGRCHPCLGHYRGCRRSGALVTAARVPTAMAANTVRLSTHATS